MFQNFKVNINISIITLFMFLLGLIGFSIIAINYDTLNKVLNTSAQNSIEQTSRLVRERIYNYLLPFNRDLIEIEYFLNHGILVPTNRSQFDPFIIELIRNNPEIFSIYYGTKDGDSIGVDREKKQGISLNLILNSKKPPSRVQYEYDEQGRFVRQSNIPTPFDPRNRPWYQQAVQAKKMVWTNIYKFYSFDEHDYRLPGISAAVPIYDANNNLEGVLGMDLTVDGIQHFINQLQITDNAIIYVTNEYRQVIAYKNTNQKEDIRGKLLTSEHLETFQIPLPLEVFDKKHQHQLVSTYRYKNQDYFLSVQQPIMKGNGEEPWQITIIVPVSDVLAPLRSISIRHLIFTILILLLGVVIARYLSKKISRPIIQLAREARDIKNLDLKPRPPLNTRIKEIGYMDKSFSNMRTSLTSFQRYVPNSLVKKLMKSGKIAKVGGQLQNITILFSDIQNFTQMSESASPEQLMTYLSDYFQMMTESVIIHQGMLDKYIGDAIMALWNTPLPDENHAYNACKTAVDMMERIEVLNKKNRELQLPEFTIRIGINSGEAVVGNVGSQERLNFTALGDAVNLTSRLESVNKIYHTQIIVSKSTYDQVSSKFAFRFLDEVAVRGKRESTPIYELIMKQDVNDLEQYQWEFAKAYDLYQQGNWLESLKLFKQMPPAYEGDQLADLYIQRCQALLDNPPEFWDSVWRIDDHTH